jgi:hypothetical protein
MTTAHKKNVQLDALLVHAAMHGLFDRAAIGLGLTANEAYSRAAWLKEQSDSYVQKVAEAVAKLEEAQGWPAG